jgi:hypothetical protein
MLKWEYIDNIKYYINLYEISKLYDKKEFVKINYDHQVGLVLMLQEMIKVINITITNTNRFRKC